MSDLAESNEEYPSLKHQKAAKIRWFAPVALELAKEHNEGRSGKHREAAAKELVKLYDLLGSPWRDWNKKQHDFFLQRSGENDGTLCMAGQ